ncbi:uncharacterized protein I303_100720 [Kwoniella dejecticola CBS 10117]|uniref:peptidylprolyl isomerase n=1 Tax=Kwoniella dejecticola CBS 10117 TaxID=1296121 RepID=A0A1A6AFR0_9TREE|nr:uncharacterized protein I303_00723 [Kwoniella dejecticola CBS 10117]OBR88905.1 hypothetical protein I303_00723 [Kwoniella dejecticola CBS 10117]
MPNPRTFFDFSVGDKPLGRVVFELFNDVVPMTADNFRALCTGEKGISKISNVPLHYKGCPVHRVIDGFMIQGGDFTKRNGSGGESIYGGPFEDERLEGEGTEVDKKGLLVMANRGPNTNGSQFFITLAPSPHLTGRHVVFGKVVFGLEHIEAIGKLSTDDRDRPLTPVVISHCGELELRRPPPQQARSPSVSSSRSRSASPDRRRKSKSRSKSRRDDSDEDDSDDSEGRDRDRRRSKKKKDRRDRERKEKDRKKTRKPREETEEELDARLEREEKELLEKQRLERLEAMKKQIEQERQKIKDDGGVVYKGRGAMRYLDPETTHRSMPTNFNSRAPDTRPRAPRGPPPHLSDRIGDSRERSRDYDRDRDRGDRREVTQRDRLDRDMDRWQHDRSQAQAVSDRERAKFRRGRSDSLDKPRSASPPPRGRSESRSRSRSRSPVRNGTVSPARARTRSRSAGAGSDNSDMVLDLED